MKKKKLNVTEIETQTNEHWIQTVDRGNSEALLSKCKATSPATSKKMWISWKWQKKNRNNFNRRTHEENQYSPILLWHANTGCKRQPLCLKRRLRQSCIAAPKLPWAVCGQHHVWGWAWMPRKHLRNNELKSIIKTYMWRSGQQHMTKCVLLKISRTDKQ